MIEVGRRGFLRDCAALFAAPAIVRVASIMPVRQIAFLNTDVLYPLGETIKNGLLTPSIITRETLMIFRDNLIHANRVNTVFEYRFAQLSGALRVRS